MSHHITIKLQTATVVETGIQFMQYGNYYLNAAEHLPATALSVWFDPLPYQLLCQSLELHLKSFIWLSDRLSRNAIKNKYGHDIEKLWRHSKAQGLARYCEPTRLRDETIALLGPYYKKRQFVYLDFAMSAGIPKIRAHRKARGIMTRLYRRLSTSLHKPILYAS